MFIRNLRRWHACAQKQLCNGCFAGVWALLVGGSPGIMFNCEKHTHHAQCKVPWACAWLTSVRLLGYGCCWWWRLRAGNQPQSGRLVTFGLTLGLEVLGVQGACVLPTVTDQVQFTPCFFGPGTGHFLG
jgi:hypothetical protein